MSTETWVSVEETAKHLSVVKDTIYRWIERKGMPPTGSVAFGSSSSARFMTGSAPAERYRARLHDSNNGVNG